MWGSNINEIPSIYAGTGVYSKVKSDKLRILIVTSTSDMVMINCVDIWVTDNE